MEVYFAPFKSLTSKIYYLNPLKVTHGYTSRVGIYVGENYSSFLGQNLQKVKNINNMYVDKNINWDKKFTCMVPHQLLDQWDGSHLLRRTWP